MSLVKGIEDIKKDILVILKEELKIEIKTYHGKKTYTKLVTSHCWEQYDVNSGSDTDLSISQESIQKAVERIMWEVMYPQN